MRSLCCNEPRQGRLTITIELLLVSTGIDRGGNLCNRCKTQQSRSHPFKHAYLRHVLAATSGIMPLMKQLVIISFVAALGACAAPGAITATLTPEQCAADWRAVGAADARDGDPISKIDAYAMACARGGAPLSPAEITAWRTGWNGGASATASANTADDDLRTDTRSTEAENRRNSRGSWRGPRIYPTFGLGVGIGSSGTRIGSRVGIGIGFPVY